MMKSVFLSLGLLFVSNAALAGPKCTEEAKDKWKDQESFKKSLEEQGYKIKKFKVTSGNCYEIYGTNKDNKKVEIYFNPVDGSVAKEETKD
jgi:hypothetical protein